MKDHIFRIPDTLVGLLTLLSLFACNVSITETVTSGTNADEMTEEPLSEDELRFEDALHFSNNAMELISNQNYSALYALGSGELHGTITLKNFQSMLRQAELDLGTISEYRDTQWAFTERAEKGRKVLYSTKIAIQGSTPVYYHFKFADEDYQAILAIHIDPKRSTDTVSIAINRVFPR